MDSWDDFTTLFAPCRTIRCPITPAVYLFARFHRTPPTIRLPINHTFSRRNGSLQPQPLASKLAHSFGDSNCLLRFFDVGFDSWIANSDGKRRQKIQGVFVEGGQNAVGYAELIQDQQVMGFGEFYALRHQQGLEIFFSSLLRVIAPESGCFFFPCSDLPAISRSASAFFIHSRGSWPLI
jgi:hypothetical protein